MIEVSMLGACPKEAQSQVHDLLKALIVTDRENFRVREVAMIAGAGKEEIRIFLTCDLSQARLTTRIQRLMAEHLEPMGHLCGPCAMIIGMC